MACCIDSIPRIRCREVSEVQAPLQKVSSRKLLSTMLYRREVEVTTTISPGHSVTEINQKS